MPRLLAVTLLALFACTAAAQPADGDAPVTPDAPVGTVSKITDEGFSVGRFELNNANDLAVVCSLSEEHPDYTTAHAFCIGYMTGAINYYRAIADSPGMESFICNDRPIPRTELVTAFLNWSAAHPQLDPAPAVENVMRAAAQKWPCPFPGR
jgi:hypothetical protein